MEIKEFTLAVAQQYDDVLMGLKNPSRFGGGFWNFPGGKPETGETYAKAALREFSQESGLVAKSYHAAGVLDFEFVEGPVLRRVHLFVIDAWEGELRETTPEDEIIELRWFNRHRMPYEQMFPADRYWFPFFAEGKPFPKKFLYNNTREFRLLEPKGS